MNNDEDGIMLDTELLYANKFIEQKHPPLEVKWKYVNSCYKLP